MYSMYCVAAYSSIYISCGLSSVNYVSNIYHKVGQCSI